VPAQSGLDAAAVELIRLGRHDDSMAPAARSPQRQGRLQH